MTNVRMEFQACVCVCMCIIYTHKSPPTAIPHIVN